MKYSISLSLLLLVIGVAYAEEASIPDQNQSISRPTPEEERLALQAYTFAFPMILMEFTMRSFTNVPCPDSDVRAPMNQFGHAREFQGPGVGVAVRTNPDTLYSSGFFNISQEPMILITPESDRYYVLQLIDMWSETIASPGTRTTGNGYNEFAIYLDGWSGTLPEGVIPIKATTSIMWIIGRIQIDTAADYEHVHKIQDGLKLVPLSEYGNDYIPPTEVPTKPEWEYNGVNSNDIALSLDQTTYLSLFTNLLKAYPPRVSDWNMMNVLKSIGIEQGKPFNPSLFPKVENLTKKMGYTLKNYRDFLVTTPERWVYSSLAGAYASNYAHRSLVSLFGLVANLLEDAVYYTTRLDEDGNAYNGAVNSYFIDITTENAPPVNGFWSITLYDSDGYTTFNEINRVAFGDRDFPRDTNIRIVISHEKIEEEEGVYWLPAPADEFNMMLRLYYPTTKVLLGNWTPPNVQKIKPEPMVLNDEL